MVGLIGPARAFRTRSEMLAGPGDRLKMASASALEGVSKPVSDIGG